MKRTSTTASCLLAADAPNDAVLEHAQQLRLQRQRHLGEFVEEERAAVRDLEQAGLVAVRAGEGALPVTEQLRLSSRPSGSAAQLIGTIGRLRAGCAGG